MATTYVGNEAATEAPSAAPAAGVRPSVSIPADADAFNVATMFNQAYRVFADFIAYIMRCVFLTPPSLVSDTPQAIWKDAAGSNRSLVDHNGYPMGRRSEFREEWVCAIGTVSSSATIALLPRWGATIVGTSTITASAPVATYPGNFALLSATGAGSGSTAELATASGVINTANTFMSAVVEFEASIRGADASNQTDIYMGFASSGHAAATDFIRLHCDRKALGNWFAQCSASSTLTATDTGVAPAIAVGDIPSQRIRIEFHGSTSTYGAGKARFFINDALVATVTTNIPATGMYLSFACVGSGSNSNIKLTVGPVLMSWNRFQSIAGL